MCRSSAATRATRNSAPIPSASPFSIPLSGDMRAQHAYSADFHFERIAGLHPQRRLAAMADAFGRAGRNDVARGKRGEVGANAMICGME